MILSKVYLPMEGRGSYLRRFLALICNSCCRVLCCKERKGSKGGNTHYSRKELNGFCFGKRKKIHNKKLSGRTSGIKVKYANNGKCF